MIFIIRLINTREKSINTQIPNWRIFSLLKVKFRGDMYNLFLSSAILGCNRSISSICHLSWTLCWMASTGLSRRGAHNPKCGHQRTTGCPKCILHNKIPNPRPLCGNTASSSWGRCQNGRMDQEQEEVQKYSVPWWSRARTNDIDWWVFADRWVIRSELC